MSSVHFIVRQKLFPRVAGGNVGLERSLLVGIELVRYEEDLIGMFAEEDSMALGRLVDILGESASAERFIFNSGIKPSGFVSFVSLYYVLQRHLRLWRNFPKSA